MTTAALAAEERQLDWLLEEVLGPARPTTQPRHGWLAAALLLLAIGTAFGVAWLRGDVASRSAQQPAGEVPWTEVHGGGAGLEGVPSDALNLRCFDFDDAAIGLLERFTKLERLDLSGMDVNDRGYAVSLEITDAGVARLGKLTTLRWLSLAQCHEVKGEGLRVLEALPLLEYLDLTYSGVESPAVERLAMLGTLRELSLSHCLRFHGRSLAEVAKIPGLRTIRLRGCATLAAADVMHLTKVRSLRHLDLRDCQGRFRGQTANAFSTGGEEPPPPPKQDEIGITDAVVAAIAVLPLETLLLGGSESLTDAIGESLAKMTSLRHVDLSNLPKTTAGLLASLPPGLESLALDQNPHFDAPALRRLPALSALHDLDLSGVGTFRADDLTAVLDGKQIRRLGLGAMERVGKGIEPIRGTPRLSGDLGKVVARQANLQQLELRNVQVVEPSFLAEVARLPSLARIDLTASIVGKPDTLAPLGACRALHTLSLTWCRNLTLDGLKTLQGVPLRQLDLYGTNLADADVREVAKAWPGCTIKMPKGQTWRVPDR